MLYGWNLFFVKPKETGDRGLLILELERGSRHYFPDPKVQEGKQRRKKVPNTNKIGRRKLFPA